MVQNKIKEKIGVYPTDTLYGICASAFNKKNVERIYEIKGRDENKPFIILISNLADLKKFGITLTPKQKKFLGKIWPGKISVILPCRYKKFEYLHRGREGLAFRMPNKKNIQLLLQKTGPLVAPSANKQGQKPAETVAEAKEIFGDTVDLYIPGGRLIGSPSTLITFKDDVVMCLRDGVVPFQKIQKVFESLK